MLTIVGAGLRGTALGAVAYPSVDAETTPEGYCAAQAVRVQRLVVRRRYTCTVLPPGPRRSRRSAFQAALSKRDDDTIEEPIA